MRKIIVLIISFLLILIAAFLGWYFLSRDDNTAPLGQTIKNILPFGSDNSSVSSGNVETTTEATTEIPAITTESTVGQVEGDYFKLSDTPVAGAGVFQRNALEVVRYVDRATGHIVEIVLPKSTTSSQTIEKTIISNKTLPKIYEAYFRGDGGAALLRSLKDDSDVVQNMALAFKALPATATSSGAYSVTATILRGDIGSVVVGSGNSLIYTLKDTSAIATSAFDSLNLKTLWTSSFTDWKLSGSGNSIVIATKASSQTPGYAYRFSGTGGTPTKIVGPLNALITLPNPANTRFLYSYLDDRVMKLAVVGSKGEKVAEDISPATLAEKCVWSAKLESIVVCGAPSEPIGTNEPDNWYKGLSHFSDRLWLFNTNSQIAQVLSEPKTVLGIDVDMTNLMLSPSEDYLIFTNKSDLSLWAFRL